MFAIHTLVARRDRVQLTTVATNPLQRRAGLASVQIALSSGARATVKQVERSDAEFLLHQIGRRNVVVAPVSQ
ncbi:PH domain-containing protein [Nakamurella antarctica]|uniref:PH domain-containing protein n=1 Tax=Nakamurella antarctica TaxID=1902245 RepID=UPI003BB1FA5B